MLGAGTAVATAWEMQEGEVGKPSGNGIQKLKRFEGKQFTYGTETEAGGTRCEHSALATSYLKLQMSLRCSWAQRRGTSRTGALEHCWVQLQGLGTTPENKEKLGCLMQEQGMPGAPITLRTRAREMKTIPGVAQDRTGTAIMLLWTDTEILQNLQTGCLFLKKNSNKLRDVLVWK